MWRCALREPREPRSAPRSREIFIFLALGPLRQVASADGVITGGAPGDRRFLQLGDLKELTTRVRPTGCLGDRAGRTTGLVKLPKARVGIGLQDPGVARQKGLRVLTPAIRRVEVRRRWWSRPTKGPVVS